MFSFESDLFEIQENESHFYEICSILQSHSFKSPWEMCFKGDDMDEVVDKVFEFSLNSNVKHIPDKFIQTPAENLYFNESADQFSYPEDFQIYREKMYKLKDSLMEAKDSDRIEQIKDLDMLCTLPLTQIPVLRDVLDVSLLSETAVVLLLNGILHFKMPISLTLANALVHHFIYPKICEMQNSSSRTFLTAILNFSEVYPKAVIDEVMLPCLKKEILETSQFEILFKMAKYNLPNEYVTCCIKNVIDNALPTENTFSILQCLIERKAEFDQNVYDTLTRKIQDWAASYNNNIKFTKLLTSLLSAYGPEFTNQQILIYDDVIQINKTIVKKAAENLIKKLKLGIS